MIGLIAILLLFVGIGSIILQPGGNWWLAITTTLSLLFSMILGFKTLTGGNTLVAPFLEDKDGNIHFGAYLLNEKENTYKWLIRPHYLKTPYRKGWLKRDDNE